MLNAIPNRTVFQCENLLSERHYVKRTHVAIQKSTIEKYREWVGARLKYMLRFYIDSLLYTNFCGGKHVYTKFELRYLCMFYYVYSYILFYYFFNVLKHHMHFIESIFLMTYSASYSSVCCPYIF